MSDFVDLISTKHLSHAAEEDNPEEHEAVEVAENLG